MKSLFRRGIVLVNDLPGPPDHVFEHDGRFGIRLLFHVSAFDVQPQQGRLEAAMLAKRALVLLLAQVLDLNVTVEIDGRFESQLAAVAGKSAFGHVSSGDVNRQTRLVTRREVAMITIEETRSGVNAANVAL